jgi:phosphoadenosine phosphosulfate reductase
MNLDLRGRAMDDIAIERLQEFEAAALHMSPEGFWLGFSGGKDSVVILDLAKRAGVKFQAYYNVTTVDPPQLVRFIRTFPDVRWNLPELSMAALIRREKTPPHKRMPILLQGPQGKRGRAPRCG